MIRIVLFIGCLVLVCVGLFVGWVIGTTAGADWVESLLKRLREWR